MKPGQIMRLFLVLAIVTSTQALGVVQTTRGGGLSQSLKVVTALEDKWVEITSPDKDFTAAFPVQPEFKVYDHRETRRPSFIAWHDGHTLMASYYDVIIPTDQVNSDYEVKLREYEEAMMMKSLREQGWKILVGRGDFDPFIFQRSYDLEGLRQTATAGSLHHAQGLRGSYNREDEEEAHDLTGFHFFRAMVKGSKTVEILDQNLSCFSYSYR